MSVVNGKRKNKQMINHSTKCLLFCEGADEYYFLIHVLGHYVERHSKLNDIQVVNFGGINDLALALRNWQAVENFEHILALGIVRDVENVATSAASSISDALRQAGLSVPTKRGEINKVGKIATGYELFDDTLEDVCLRIIKEDKKVATLTSVQKFLEETEQTSGFKYSRLHKNLLATYMGATNKFVTMKIGEATKAGAFDLEHDSVKKYVDFMLALVASYTVAEV